MYCDYCERIRQSESEKIIELEDEIFSLKKSGRNYTRASEEALISLNERVELLTRLLREASIELATSCIYDESWGVRELGEEDGEAQYQRYKIFKEFLSKKEIKLILERQKNENINSNVRFNNDYVGGYISRNINNI